MRGHSQRSRVLALRTSSFVVQVSHRRPHPPGDCAPSPSPAPVMHARASIVLGCLLPALLATKARDLRAQATVPPAAAVDTTASMAVKVFLDCQSARCDFDFFRDQMRWVNWVRDRQFAEVQLLVTSLRTGSGGNEYTVSAIGGARYRGRADTATVSTLPNDSDDAIRRSLARTFSLLLAPYAARTPLAPHLSMSFTAPSSLQASTGPATDRWNYWVYRL